MTPTHRSSTRPGHSEGPLVPVRGRPLAGVCAAAAVTLLLAGCSGSDDVLRTTGQPTGSTSPEPGVTAAPSATGPAASSPAATAPVTGSATPVPGTASAAPAVSAKPGQVVTGAVLAARMRPAVAAAGGRSVTVTGSGAQPVTASGRSVGTGSALELTLKGDVGTMSNIEIITTGSDEYLKASSLATAARPWLKITDSPKDPYRALYDNVFSGLATTGDVGAAVTVVSKVARFTAGATDTAGGVSCTNYAAKPPAKLVVTIMPQSFASLDAATLKDSAATLAVCLDQAGLVHRVTTSLVLPGTGSSGTARSEVVYSGWGATVSVSPPPAAKIAPAPS